MIKKYQITPILWLVRDEAGVKFHVKSDDYFGTIATVLSLLKQQIKKDGHSPAAVQKTLNNLERDLLFLQKNYQIHSRPLLNSGHHQINPKIKNRKIKPKGRLNSQ